MKQHTDHSQGLGEEVVLNSATLHIRERAERLYRMGELEAAAELLMLEAIQ